MATLKELTVTEEKLRQAGMRGLTGSSVSGQAERVKELIDGTGLLVAREGLNPLIALLGSQEAAAQLGAAPFNTYRGTNVQTLLQELYADLQGKMDELVAGSLPSDTIDTKNLKNGAVTREKLDEALRLALMPAGAIVLWSGAADALPAGWLLCNGEQGTPDLRDRFVLGASGAYAVGSKGGLASVALTEAQMPRHRHAPSRYRGNDPQDTQKNIMINGSGGGRYDYSGYDSDVIAYSGSSAAHENRPPYYALCYMMRGGATA